MALGHSAKDYLGPKEAGGSGGGNFIIEVSFEDGQDTGEAVDSSVKFSDIVSAYNAGKRIVVYATGTKFQEERYVEMTTCVIEEGAISQFSAMYTYGVKRTLDLYEEEGTIKAYSGTFS